MTNNKPILNIKATDKVTHSRRIAIGSLIEVFKAHCGAPEQATVLWPAGSGMVPPFDAREVEIIWTDDELPKKTLDVATETTYGGHPATTPFEEWSKPPVVSKQGVTKEVATGDVQVGDLVMVSNKGASLWAGPYTIRAIEIDHPSKYLANDNSGFRWELARHLTDEERAQIKRI